MSEPLGRGEGWRLQNVEELNAVHPRSYFIPAAAERAALKPGDIVKLVFFLEDPPAGSPEAERMWVRVAGREGEVYNGFLDNQPSLIQALQLGDAISFRPEHVAAIAHDPATLGYHPALRAIVSRRVVQEDVFPRRIYKDEPLRPADSGWTILVGDETRDELEDAASFVSSDLGYLTDKFPPLAEPFRSPGGEWLWDSASSRFAPL